MLLAHQFPLGVEEEAGLSGWEESVMMTEEYNTHINAIKISKNRSLSKRQVPERKRYENKENQEYVNRMNLHCYNKNALSNQGGSKGRQLSSICQLREEMKNINKMKNRWQGKEFHVPIKNRPKSGYFNPPAKIGQKQDIDCIKIIKSINTCRLIKKRPAIVHNDNEYLAVFSSSINERPKSIHSKSINRPQSSRQSKQNQTKANFGFTINQIENDIVKEILKDWQGVKSRKQVSKNIREQLD